MRILTLDIETFPNTAHVWALWDQNVGLPQLLESGEVACFAAKWHDEKRIMFFSKHKEGKDAMIMAAYYLVCQADVVIHFNGKKFDMPWLNSEWVRMGLTPPSPYAEVDLCQIVKQRFKFPSNKLDYCASELLGKKKVKNVDGHELWIACMNGDDAAWKQMEKYNRYDVVLTEALYDRIRGWVPNLPNPALYNGDDHLHTCPECQSTNLTKEGYAYTKVSKFQRYCCDDCGRWSRDGRRVDAAQLR